MMRVRRLAALAVGVGLFAVAPCATLLGQLPRAVTTHVVVTENDDEMTPVPAVAAEALTLRIDGVVTPIVRLEAARPLSLVLLVDVTSSMSEAMASFVWDGRGRTDDVNPSGYKPPDSPSALWLAPITRGLLSDMEADDRVRVGRVAQPPQLGPAFTADRRMLQESVRQVLDVPAAHRHAETPTWDALDMAIATLEGEAGRRRAIVLATDGLATGNRVGLDAVIDRAVRADVAIFVIGEAWRLRSPRGWSLSIGGPWVLMSGAFERTPWSQLRRLASATGGVFVPDGEHGWPEPERRLQTVVSLLRASYAVTFESPLPPGDTGVLTVDLTGTGRQVHVKGRHVGSLR